MADTIKQRENSTSRTGEGVAAPLEPSALQHAKDLVYSVRGWQTRSPEFMVTMSERFAEKIADHAAAVSKNLQEKLELCYSGRDKEAASNWKLNQRMAELEMQLARVTKALEHSFGGKSVMNADEIISSAKLMLGKSPR